MRSSDPSLRSTFDADDRFTHEYGPQNAGTAQTRQTVYAGLSADPDHKLSQTDYAYNLQGRLAEVSADTDADGTPDHVTQLAYAADGTCVGETLDGQATAFLVDHQNFTGASQVLEEKDAAGGVLRSYTLGWDVIAQQAPAAASGATLYLLKDGLGSTRGLCGPSGQPVSGQTYAFDAFGNPLGFDPAAALAGRLYNGERYMAGAGLYDLRSRVYNTSLGRFPTSDGYAGALYSPSSLHRYAYCHGDSINFADPSGRSESFETGMMLGVNAAIDRFFFNALIGAGLAALDPILQGEAATLDQIAWGAAGGMLFPFVPVPIRMIAGGIFAREALIAARQSFDNGYTAQGIYRTALAGLALASTVADAESTLQWAARPRSMPTTESPYQVHIDPITHRGPMAIDSSTFTSGEATLAGGIRNARQFWTEWARRYPETLSTRNQSLISEGLSPEVDGVWTRHFPEHSPYLDRLLIHHHLDYGPQAIPLPEPVHAEQPGRSIWHQ